MGRQKLKRFGDNSGRENILEPGKEIYTKIKGVWHQDFFENPNPITLEIGCGRGEYTVGLASVFPDKNFIGIDIKGNRIWVGSTNALENGLNNVGFLRTKIQSLETFFAEDEINEIWIPFPDPRSKGRDQRRRLTHPRFLKMYKKLLRRGGLIHLKTDSIDLFNFTLETLSSLSIEPIVHTFDLYQDQTLLEHHFEIKTKYEKLFVAEGFKINYMQFNLDGLN